MFDAKKFLEFHFIPFKTEGKNIGSKWIGVLCPFCNDASFHGGFATDRNKFSCWRCGSHLIKEVISELLNVNEHGARQLFKQFSSNSPNFPTETTAPRKNNSIEIPGKKLLPMHIDYLRSRRFDPDKLVQEYNIRGTNQLGKYKFRIIIPIYFQGKIVSYIGRDVTRKSKLRYKACPSELEIISHREILYGLDNANNTTVILVEGITDVWRLGENSIACFGLQFSDEQVLLLVQRFSEVIISFDREVEAIRRARKLQRILEGLGIEARIAIPPKRDPAEMTDTEIRSWKKSLLGA